MKDLTAHYPERKMREFWTFDDNSYQVMQCQGFSCGPENDWWWLPEAGYSVDQSSLFTSEKAALTAALKQSERELAELRVIVAKLKAKL